MKRIITILAAMVITTVSSLAQESQETFNYREKVPHLYTTAELNIAGGEFQGWGKPDFGLYGFAISPGYRFNQNWSLFVPITADLILVNRQSTQNYVEQGTLGLGASYTIPMKDHTAIEVVLSGGSTYIKSDINYFKAKAAVNLGFHGLGCSPYVGIGCSYLTQYNTGKNLSMLEISIGFTIF